MRFRVVDEIADQSDTRVPLLARLGRGKKLVLAKAKGRRRNNNVGSSPNLFISKR